MRKRWLIGIIVLIGACVIVALVFPSTFLVSLGFFRHEAFFGGKPTNYWVRAVKHEPFLGQPAPTGDVGKTLREGRAAAVPVLREMTQDPSENVRTEALLALCLMGPEAKGATQTLSATISTEENSSLFLLASEALGKVDPAAAAEALSAVLRKKEPSRRSWALAALLKIAPQGQEALPILNEMFHDQDEDTRLRVQAILVLFYMKQPAEPLVVALCAIADADKGTAGVQAVEALGDMGPAAKPGVPALVKLLERPNLAVSGKRWGAPHQAAIIRTLGKMGPEASDSIPACITILKSDKHSLYGGVALALAQMGGSAKAAVPTLLQALADGKSSPHLDEQTRQAFREAVQRIDPDAAARAGVH